MIRYLPLLFLCIILALLLQQFLPTMSSLHEARILILPLTFLCCAVTVNVPAMLFLAFISGIFWDLSQYLYCPPVEHSLYQNPVETMRFGYSCLLFALMGFGMFGIQPLFREGKWYFSALLSGFVLFLYLIVDFGTLTFVRGEPVFPRQLFHQMLLSALISMALSPLIFFILYKLAAWSRYTISYEGLKKSHAKK